MEGAGERGETPLRDPDDGDGRQIELEGQCKSAPAVRFGPLGARGPGPKGGTEYLVRRIHQVRGGQCRKRTRFRS